MIMAMFPNKYNNSIFVLQTNIELLLNLNSVFVLFFNRNFTIHNNKTLKTAGSLSNKSIY